MTLPQILQRKICSPSGENIHDFPLENPKIKDFRWVSKDRPYSDLPHGFFASLCPPQPGRAFQKSDFV